MNSASPLTSHRKFGSSPAASVCASASSADGEGLAKRSSTLAALILSRLPDAASTCSEVSLSTRTLPALNAPSSSKKTCIGEGNCGEKGRGLYRSVGELLLKS